MKRVVFCDFDGTITAVETFAGMLKDFAPQLSAQLMPEIYAMRLTLREGVRQMLESIPATRYPEILAYVESKPTRPGLEELLDFLDSQGIPFIVVSGGLRGMVEAVLSRAGKHGQSLVDRVTAIYAVDVDTGGEFLQVISEFEGDSELVSKVEVMARYPADEQIAIGDSLTDLNMALTASVVFARDRLTEYLDERHKPYIPWNDFFDVRQQLSERWQDS
ncbi:MULTISPECIES: HAD-IB family phosphatase [unclassified Coleofasciculus]|uniref:HAD-IB family phosphatase n=1 Tax=unclassified Coleofasciculus TaxID=2692782 RepID=UPI00187F817C|nr:MULTISPECIES: HAD-IB family phosphatase [unclassified Coleofasciculus]MBE9130243.1 HAD-IB family phosphatase [Coleofasciculus sp. LEGE 07081]MBE9152541.1 HAD-IB family phosphatase [Coleofasciculus sp. LEGE 07092]